jgi:DNA-binding MarR family transcriptional regulator
MTLEKEIKQTRPFRNEYHKASVNIVFTGKWMQQIGADMLRRFDLTLQQYNVLRILKGKYPDPVNLGYIRHRMLDPMSDASRVVENLRKKGLIERNIREDNRRMADILITETGITLVEETYKENDRMDKLLHALNDDEIAQLNFLLDKLRNK